MQTVEKKAADLWEFNRKEKGSGSFAMGLRKLEGVTGASRKKENLGKLTRSGVVE